MIGAFIYSRLSSKRLPRKALLPLGSNSLIETVIENTKNDKLYKTILLTSNEEDDDELEKIGIDAGIEVFRDSLENVALRTLNCINKYKVTSFLRVNGDSPLINNIFYRNCLLQYHMNDIEIYQNINPRTFPYGYSIEIINAETFKNSFKFFCGNDFEHITQYFYRNKNCFKIYSLENNTDFSNLQFTIDDYKSYNIIASLFLKYPNINSLGLEEKIKLFNNE